MFANIHKLQRDCGSAQAYPLCRSLFWSVEFEAEPPGLLTHLYSQVIFFTVIKTYLLKARSVARERNELTDREWELMDALWDAGLATATDIQNQMRTSRGWAYSTVKTMLDRLVAMG